MKSDFIQEWKFVSIILPCLNEEQYISGCLDSILANDYPQDRYEIFIVDGGSTDSTRKIIKDIALRNSNIKFLDNPHKFTPFAFNLGIKHSKGEIIFLMGSHSYYTPDYISQCVKYLYEYEADNVGGRMVTHPRKNTLIDKAIAEILSHPFGVGNSVSRIGLSKPLWVDNVSDGCYRKDVFDRIGLFNEKLIRSQDMKLNLRLRKAGGKILFVPSIVSEYFPKSSLIDFIRHSISKGTWAVIPMKFTIQPLSLRHIVPFFFTSGIFLIVALSIFFSWFFQIFLMLTVIYALFALFSSFNIAKVKREWRYIYCLPFMFFLLHFFYGFGSIIGMLKLIFRRI